MANKLNLSFHQTLFNSSPNGIVVYNPSFECIMINKVGCEILHLTEKQALNKQMKKLIPGIENTPRYKKYKETLVTGTPFSVSFTITVDSEEQHIRVNTCKVNENLALFFSDVTTALNKTRSLVDMQQAKISELDSLLFGISSPVFFKDKKSKYTSVNNACASFLGLKPKDMIGKTAKDIMTEDDVAIIAEEERKIFSGEVDVLTVEAPRFNAKGKLHWFSNTTLPLKDAYGTIIGLLGISFDITQKKITELELDLLATAMQQISEIMVITDRDGTIQYVNPAFEKITGYSAEEAVGGNPSILQSGKHTEAFYNELWNTIKKGDSWQGHFINKKKNGSIYEEDAYISPLIADDGEITNFIAAKRDVTKELTLENQLRQSQKMEAIGRLAGGVAHDFNNILTAILGYSELILTSIDKKNPIFSKVDEIRKAGKRATSLTNQMLAFSKKQVVRYKTLNVNSIINEFVNMLKRIIGENIHIKLRLAPTLDPVFSDKSQFEQIIMNLVVNARDAISDSKGEVLIETGNAYFKKEFSDGNFESPPGAYVMIKITDNGCGISEENLKYIFEPFFSQKNGTSSAGLGLSTVYGIVKQHNGSVYVESKIGERTVFKVFLPVAVDESSSPYEDTAEGEAFTTGSGTVILVEDEQSVLELATSILELSGYTVLPFPSAEALLKKYDKIKEEVILLITDIVLSGMRGDEMVVKLRKKTPALKVLYMSGYAGEAEIKKGFHGVNSDFLEKPFSMENFLSQVSKLLASDSDRKE